MPELVSAFAGEALDAAALLVAVLCWGAVLFPAAGYWSLYTQRARS
jgi:hypothetical protein